VMGVKGGPKGDESLSGLHVYEGLGTWPLERMVAAINVSL
jgi:hypothetical protein